MIDPARPEAREAVAMCKTAGIRPVTITGDHPTTALAIARELGIAADGQALTCPELDRLPAAKPARHVDEVALFARVTPEHKRRIVQALQQRGQIVAMTGDGVNEGPALKAADIGVVMGMAGTDVAKEAAAPPAQSVFAGGVGRYVFWRCPRSPTSMAGGATSCQLTDPGSA